MADSSNETGRRIPIQGAGDPGPGDPASRSPDSGSEAHGDSGGEEQAEWEIPAPLEEPEDPLAQLQAELEAERDSHLRVLAELRNYRQRVGREQAEQARYQTGQLLTSLLPTLDHLEMALRSAEEHGEGDTALAEGVFLTYRQLLDTLAGFGLEPIPAEGQMFDPDRHEAAEREEVQGDLPCEGTITAELRKGYLLYDRVLRPAQVRVAVQRRDAPPSAG